MTRHRKYVGDGLRELAIDDDGNLRFEGGKLLGRIDDMSIAQQVVHVVNTHWRCVDALREARDALSSSNIPEPMRRRIHDAISAAEPAVA